jgi:arylsulfatase A-like enzyme
MTIGYDFMGFTGKLPWLKTPNMDRLFNEGAYFKNAFVTTSLCSSSRASILTGAYSHVPTIVDNQAPEPPNNIYFPQYLQKAGYQTAFLGKWNMGEEAAADNPRPGFNHWESFKGQGVYYNPTLNIDGKQASFKDSAYIRIRRFQVCILAGSPHRIEQQYCCSFHFQNR